MGRKIGRKEKGQTKKEKAKPKSETPGSSAVEDDRMDFGGLPDRDLKKNLGCG